MGARGKGNALSGRPSAIKREGRDRVGMGMLAGGRRRGRVSNRKLRGRFGISVFAAIFIIIFVIVVLTLILG